MFPERWIRSRRDWIFAGLSVVTFAILDLLVLIGFEAALYILSALTGMLLGTLLAYPVSPPLRRATAGASPAWRGVAAFGTGLASIFAIVLSGLYVFDVPVFPSSNSGTSGALVFGVAIGFGGGLRRRLSPAATPTLEESLEENRADLRLMLVVAGAIAGLLASTFVIYILIQYVLSPLIRYLAA